MKLVFEYSLILNILTLLQLCHNFVHIRLAHHLLAFEALLIGVLKLKLFR
jgi:hypothetical protein